MFQTLKRQLKDAKDTVQRQRLDIEALKGKLDMSVSKLTGTERALSEALREHKQEKDKVPFKVWYFYQLKSGGLMHSSNWLG